MKTTYQFPLSNIFLSLYTILTITANITLASEDYGKLMEALYKEADTVRDDYCYACFRAATLVGIDLTEDVRMSIQNSDMQDWYRYLGDAYEDLVRMPSGKCGRCRLFM